MASVMIRSIALLLALTLAHPALAQTARTPKKPPAASAAQPGLCIGVIPHIGDRFAVQQIGITIFGNDLKEVPIEPWGLDDLVVARVRAAAGARFAVRRIAYGSRAFDPYDNPPSRLFRNGEADLKAVVQSITHAGECERYVVVVKGSAQYSNTNQRMEGIGVLHSGIGNGLLSRTNLFAISSLMVLDGRSYEILKRGAGGGGTLVLQSLMLGGRTPMRELEDFAWPPMPDAVMSLREPTRVLLAESLDKALPDLLAQ
jgi:hypothetical protein